LTMCLRMMFGDWAAQMQATRILNGCAVGINPSTEWQMLVKCLLKHGPDVGSGDFAKFDASEQPMIQERIVEEINRWYGDGYSNARIRRVLWLEFYHSRHLNYDYRDKRPVVVQWFRSNPSGFALTTHANNMYNHCLFNLCWNALIPDKRSKFWDNAYLITYGDDNALNPGHEQLESFSQERIALQMAKYGATYTSSKKDVPFEPYGPIEGIDFIKRGFRFDERLHRWVGPLKLESALYAPYWAKNRVLMDEILESNIEFMLQELALHDPSVWQLHVPRILRRLKRFAEKEPKLLPDRAVYQDAYQQDAVVFGR